MALAVEFPIANVRLVVHHLKRCQGVCQITRNYVERMEYCTSPLRYSGTISLG